MINAIDMLMYLRYCNKVTQLQVIKITKGMDFTGRIENVDSNLRGYEGCYRIDGLLNKLRITKADSILDIGCGKGLFLYYASKYNFGRIDGIEYSPELAKKATCNMKQIADDRIHVYNCDARKYNDYGNYNYFFVNNPFGREIMEDLIAKIEECKKWQRRLTVIYQFPFNQEIFVQHGFKVIYEKFPNSVLTFE